MESRIAFGGMRHDDHDGSQHEGRRESGFVEMNGGTNLSVVIGREINQLTTSVTQVLKRLNFPFQMLIKRAVFH